MSRVHSSAAPSLLALSVLALSLLTASCAVSPYSGQPLSSNEVQFDGFVDANNVQVRLEAFDYGLNKYVPFTTVKPETTPAFAAGAICPNSPALYRYRGKIALNYWIYWKQLGGANWEAKVRAFKVTSTGETPVFFTTNPNGGSCMADNAFNNTCDFYNVASSKCGFSIHEAVVKRTANSPWLN